MEGLGVSVWSVELHGICFDWALGFGGQAALGILLVQVLFPATVGTVQSIFVWGKGVGPGASA